MGCTTIEARELELEARRSWEDEVWLCRAGRFNPLATSETSVRESTRLGGMRPAIVFFNTCAQQSRDSPTSHD